MIMAKPPTRASAPSSARRPRGQRLIDPLGVGALLFAAMGFVAVLVLFRPGPYVAPAEMSKPAVLIDRHHPVDKHDDVVQTSWAQIDVHHPVDRHEQP